MSLRRACQTASAQLQGNSQICSFRSSEKGSPGAVIEYVQDDSSVTADANSHRRSIDPHRSGRWVFRSYHDTLRAKGSGGAGKLAGTRRRRSIGPRPGKMARPKLVAGPHSRGIVGRHERRRNLLRVLCCCALRRSRVGRRASGGRHRSATGDRQSRSPMLAYFIGYWVIGMPVVYSLCFSLHQAHDFGTGLGGTELAGGR